MAAGQQFKHNYKQCVKDIEDEKSMQVLQEGYNYEVE